AHGPPFEEREELVLGRFLRGLARGQPREDGRALLRRRGHERLAVHLLREGIRAGKALLPALPVLGVFRERGIALREHEVDERGGLRRRGGGGVGGRGG